jgi:hypothetical protein
VPHLLQKHWTSVYKVSLEGPAPTSHSGTRTRDAKIINLCIATLTIAQHNTAMEVQSVCIVYVISCENGMHLVFVGFILVEFFCLEFPRVEHLRFSPHG